jgi:hypothetical protein
MNHVRNAVTSPARQVSAWIPIAVSLAATSVLVVQAWKYGVNLDGEPGPTTHIFHLLMALQLPFVAHFAVRWLRRGSGTALLIFAAQVLAAAAAVAALYVLA